MISICIPVYNFDVRPLVGELTKQIQFIFEYEIEIILIDDASLEEFREKNRALSQLHEYIQLEKNIGRAKIRNLFLNYSSQPYLLFLDCDSSIAFNPNFIKNYLQHILSTQSLISYGGRIYPQEIPTKNQTLSWKYGSCIESKPADLRKIDPNKSFQTNNFIIHRSLFQNNLFDESLIDYGHEDTLFGLTINAKRIKIQHIENPILNHHIEENKEFLNKTKLAINNLVILINSGKIQPKDYNQIKLLKYYQFLDAIFLRALFLNLFQKIESKVLINLIGENPNLKLFNLYKLYIFIKIKKELS